MFLFVAFIFFLFFAMGAVLGSFASAVAYRTARGISWIRDTEKNAARSACPSCHHQLVARDLIPMVSWVLSKGVCRYCAVKIPLRYPLLEMVAGSLMAGWAAMAMDSPMSILLFGMLLPFSLAAGQMILAKQSTPLYLRTILVVHCLFVIAFLTVIDV